MKKYDEKWIRINTLKWNDGQKERWSFYRQAERDGMGNV